MGREIRDREYTAKDYEKFNRRIHDQVDILKEVIARPEFGRGQNCIEAELELYFMNEQSDVRPVNLQLLDMYFDNQMQGQPVSVWECYWE